ncbi:ATP-grasp domain-containing protein [Gordonia amarae]|mgnify:CR=1 FL=1|uniref:biotin carboxylase n=2 Tax=Gordonia amarae TaxID=36821 RepID=G7GJH4_9ACTN|nr:carboxyl transferase domain-containing protein [Gordonia amarae]QHN17612.1 ATP-grasp domain-containing protein [Gordonia amarae]QHN22138.1 ATP-grasp domain-containing protein [Gordonia amarae]QHN39764.1 ATP-grasp domain-containing protein [Gordonia amarae]GAB03749.1 putative acyl-CoA carboxylase [Gordonia amarae NBRC 15530]
MFSRIAIVNRGEAAMRLIHAVRDLAAETGTTIETIALYTDVDRNATFVREADITYDLGPASARPYIDLKALEQALVATRAEAAWVGWGFVAEDPAFAELCAQIGVTFIGPSPEAMRKLGDKIGGKQIAESVGVPVAPWSGGAVDTLEDAIAAANTIGYPMMLKATAGGGGRGIRVITQESDLVEAYERTRQEAARSFGSSVVFLERMVSGGRHVEVQVIADGQGTAWALGVRDCSIQRRNQKVIEESASVVLRPDQVTQLKESAERLAVAVGYSGAATVEFLYHPGDELFAFLEVNTRLQVEHSVTELTTGVDLVRAQIWVASGNKLEGTPPAERGHAVEARLNAEDPDRDFAPAPGRIAMLDLPAGPGVRVDTGVSEGDTIPADFDSMIAKIIAYGSDREQAMGRLRRAMTETRVIIEGGATNKGFVLDLLDQPEVIDGSADTGWIDRVRGEGRLVSHRHIGVALALAAIEIYEEDEQAEQHRLLTTAAGGRPQVQHHSGRPLDLKLRGATYRVRATRVGANRFRIGIDAGGQTQTADIDLHRFDRHSGQIRVNGVRHRVTTGTHGPVHLIEVDGITHRVSRDEGGVLRAPAPALVVATPLEVGAEVEAGDPVLVLESMKMETVLRAPFRARLTDCVVTVGSQVESGAPLLRLEELSDGDDEDSADSAPSTQAELDLPETAGGRSSDELLVRHQEDLRSLLLGYDAGPHDGKIVVDDYVAARSAATADGHRQIAAELDLIEVFTDLADLTNIGPSDRYRQSTEDDDGLGHVHSAREYFHTYLRSLDVERAGLPESFRSTLTKALRHYGVTELDRTPELESSVYRIFLAHQRSDAADRQPGTVGVVTTLLREWLKEPVPDSAIAGSVAVALERVVGVTQVRFPRIADLARGVAYAWFALPVLRRDRARVYTDVRKSLLYLDQHPDAADRAERIARMVPSTQPLVRLLAQRLARGNYDNSPMLEVLTRRYYGNKGLTDLRVRDIAGCNVVVADRQNVTVASVAVNYGALDAAVRGLIELASSSSVPVVADIYLSWERQPASFDEMVAALHEIVSARPIPEQLQRITATVAGTGSTVMHHHFTFRPSLSGLTEDRLIRGLHPHIAQRMQMERLHKFDLTRLRSTDDEEIYLFRAVAKENPSDDRLIAFAQVRDLTPLRDQDANLLVYPTAERTIATCLDSIRRAHARRPAATRFSTNRMVLYVWPPITATAAELQGIADRVLPTTAGAGLEEILIIGRRPDEETGELVKTAIHLSFDAAGNAVVEYDIPIGEPVEPIDAYRQKVLRAAARGNVYPYELVDLLGDFTEHDLADDGTLVPVDRPKGLNKAAIVAGLVTTATAKYPDGITRVVLLGDPTKALGALSEQECRRVIAALELAEERNIPLEWYSLSAGARVSMESGTENMDWVAAALKKIVEFTQDGREINIVVAGINVGAQPYWNAEATMLMHTKGILVMTPESAMVLTGKQALDFSGGVSAEDNFGIGGYDRVMGPNGQAQYWAPNLTAARDILMSHYDHTYVVPGESTPRSAVTADPSDRDVSGFPHVLAGSDFTTVGDIFSATANPDRKKPFDIRTVMRAVADQDHPVLERWADMADAETSVVTDAHLAGKPVCLIGIESKAVPRTGFPPSDGPDTYTAGTLFPNSSKKTARAINAASGNRPLVVLANLSGFDGSPESMRKLQLEYGAEIGRAIVNFDGPIAFCVISRYHGGAFVVFSKTLNPRMTVLAVDGSFASVLGGAPAAAAVFGGEVSHRTAADPRVQELRTRTENAEGAERTLLEADLEDMRSSVRAEKLGEVAAEFDKIHSIRRAVEVGSVDAVIPAAELRPRIIAALGD